MNVTMALLAGDSKGLVDIIGAFQRILVPSYEPIDTPEALSSWRRSLGWVTPAPNLDLVRVTATDDLAAEETTLQLSADGRRLPLATILGKRSARPEIRLYYSHWPLKNGHDLRRPILQPSAVDLPQDWVGAYHKALRAGDLEGIVETFEDDGVAREPSGGDFEFKGPDALRRFYTHLCGPETGIGLEHCTGFDDGKAYVLEYNCVNWAGTPIEPQAGVAVYVRGPSGKLSAARIYDDVDPPGH